MERNGNNFHVRSLFFQYPMKTYCDQNLNFILDIIIIEPSLITYSDLFNHFFLNINQIPFSTSQYTCLVCNLFDDEDKNQYHCDGCGICRIGGKDRFFHCEVCNMCLPMQLKTDGHRVSGIYIEIIIFHQNSLKN